MEALTYSYYLIAAGIIALAFEFIIGGSDRFQLFVIGIIAIFSGSLGMMTGSFVLAGAVGVAMILVYYVAGKQMIAEAINASAIPLTLSESNKPSKSVKAKPSKKKSSRKKK